MRYQSTNIAENILKASEAQDTPLVREIVISELVESIETQPALVVQALRDSNVHVPQDVTNRQLADKLAYALTYNDEFLSKVPNIIKVHEEGKKPIREEYASAVGVITAAITAVTTAVAGAFKQAEKKKDLEAQQEATKQVIYSKLLGEKKKTNWIPILVVSGVLLIGAIVVWRVTKK
jgi:hypothetical protein